MMGARFTLDLTQEKKRTALVELIKQHRQGYGEFNGVNLDGKPYTIPGTKAEATSGADDHFSAMGKDAGRSTKVEQKIQKMPGGIDLKKSLQSAVEYKGLTYTEADLAKLPKAEAEYRRELMKQSKQEVKMELGFEPILQAGMEVYKMIKERFGGLLPEEGEKMDAVPDYIAKIPITGILSLRFKAKEVTRASGDGPGLEAGVAKSELSGMVGVRQQLRKTRSGTEEGEPEQEGLVARLHRWCSVRFITTSALQLVLRVFTGVCSFLVFLKDAILNPTSAKALRAARTQSHAKS